ncbi:hypothetical protein RU99_GL001961 [Enterococcus casseliflavus]|nr:hypothetical protein RU99_GL001961 [Enterococcus casseliflavus]
MIFYNENDEINHKPTLSASKYYPVKKTNKTLFPTSYP